MKNYEKILSVIVPSYNVEKYIKTTLESLCSCKRINAMDIIVVNDGSTDSTLEISREFLNKFPLSVNIIDKGNGGHGSTINAGLKIAKGKYLIIVDGDDWVDYQSIDKLIDFLKYHNEDIIISGHYKNYINDNKEKHFGYEEDSGKVCDLSYIIKKGYYLKMTDISFKLSFLRRINLTIQENTFYVDDEYCTIPCKKVDKLCFSGLSYYHYRIGDTNQSTSISNTINRIKDKEKVLNKIYKDTRDVEKQTFNEVYINNRLKVIIKTIYKVYYIYYPSSRNGANEAKRFSKVLIKNSKELYEKTNRYRVILLLINRLHLKKIYNLLRLIKGKMR
jgi:glycosyltransferase involved in cell wall biosynthesis